MIRARFRVYSEDYRPVVWPIKHPYWWAYTFTERFSRPAWFKGEGA